jgi:uncharacterized protein
MGTRAIVEKFVVAFGDGRLQDALSLLDDDFVIHAAGDVPYSGDYRGADGLSELITKFRSSTSRRARTCITSSTATNVGLHCRVALRSRASGKSIETGVTEVFSVRDGLIVDIDVYYKNPSAVASLL